MTKFRNIIYLFVFTGNLFGQTLTVDLDPIGNVVVGGGINISGRVTHDGVSPPITAGSPVQLDIFIEDPSGVRILSNPTINFTAGFNLGAVETFSVTFSIPWSEDNKWQAGRNWVAHAQVTGGGNPSANDPFTLIIADLEISGTEGTPTTATPGSYIDLRGTISNLNIAATESQQFFRIQASLNGHTEWRIFPDRNNYPPNTAWPIVGSAQDLNFIFPDFFIPEDSPNGDNNITLIVDSSGIIFEEAENNNDRVHVININAGTNAVIDATVLFDSENVGSFQGNDPVRLQLVARNDGTGAVVAADNFNLTIALSRDIQFDSSDYILRQVNMGGGANSLGLGLLPNETVTVDWVQMLPDNFEGDYYILTTINQSLNPVFVTDTPVLSLRSENSHEISWVTGGQTDRSSHPSTDLDGNLVTFESFVASNTQIFLQNISNNQITQITNGNGSSFAPKISADGRYIVFHSFASDLVPGDNNNHADVFIYYVFSGYIAKISNNISGLGSNEGSFYPSINFDGSRVVFESEATNLDLNTSTVGGRQVFLFDHDTNNGGGTIKQLTNGNGDSFDASIDENGSKIVFTSFSTDLIAVNLDTNNHSDVILWDENETQKFFTAGLTELGSTPLHGDTKDSAISGNGEFVTFVSAATNMVTNKGISYVEVVDQGLGYTTNDIVDIEDLSGNGQGAEARLRVDGNGAILEVIVDDPGRDYVNPSISVTRASIIGRDANVTAHLVNPFGDVFRISVTNIKNNGRSTRVSESQKVRGLAGSEYGGNERSREPSIARDGLSIVYSTKASNLLDLNVTSTSKKVFPNQIFRPATARAIFESGIGKVVIQNPGSGYSTSGSFLIQDLSGNGSGAVVTYEIDSNGAVGSVNIINPGSGYELENTIVTIPNPGTGTGFQVAEILPPPITGNNPNRRQGGSSIHRIEMEDIGIGYPTNLVNVIEKPIIVIDGDGLDRDGVDANGDGVLDGDGQPDARVNPDLIHFGENGQIYLEQKFDINVTSTTALLSTNLLVQGYDRNVTFNFGNIDNLPFTIGVVARTEEDVRDRLILMIRSLWSNPANISDGPQIDNNQTGGKSFTLSGLNLSVSSNNPSALSVRHLSNMLINGSAFTRATPLILPEPVIHGFSEIATNGVPNIASNGRPVLHAMPELLSDDIYIYNSNSLSNRRVSVSKYGFPTNYLQGTNMPSHRFPSISGNGRYLFFSSDSGGGGGLIFDNSNQVPVPANDNNRRDIFLVDLKDNALPVTNYSIEIAEDFLIASNFKAVLNQSFPIHISATLQIGSIEDVRLYVNGNLASNFSRLTPGTNSIQTFLPWQNNQLGPHKIQVSVVDNLNNEYFSKIYQVSVINNPSSIYSADLEVLPRSEGLTIFILNPIFEDFLIILPNGLTVTDNRFNNNYEVIGPFNDGNVSDLLARGGITNIGLAQAYFSTEDPSRARPFSSVYPFRQTNTQGSSLSAKSTFVGINGKEPVLKKVSYFLNGQLIDEQIHPPYFTYFSPPALSDDNLTALDGWTLTSMATDLNDNIRIDTQLGDIFFSETFPNLELVVASGITDSQNRILDGQRIKLSARATGDFSILDKLQQVHFFINGTHFSTSTGNAVSTSDGNLHYIDYEASLDIDFSRYAKPDGSISIISFGEMNDVSGYTPIFRSNTINLTITTPMPWIDEESNVLSLFEDLTRRKPDASEVAYTMQAISESDEGIAHWIEGLLNFGAVSDRIDVVSAHRVVFGEWHSEYEQFEEDSSAYIGRISPELTALNFGNQVVDPYWLKEYISDLLTSEDYTFKFVRLPYLVGSYYSANVINYQNNRHEFIRRHYQNKYGSLPNIAQLYQGSYKMLQWWESFEPEYWELPQGTKPDQSLAFNGYDPDSPPRRDQFVPLPVIDLTDQTGTSGQIRFTYEAGEVAVDFVYSLAKEPEFYSGVPYLLETSRLRENQFSIATLMHLLWQRNADVLSDSDVNALIGLSLKDAIKAILADYRYTSRHNIIWKDSEVLGTTFPNWKIESWFGGAFMDKNFPWIYHEDLEWIFIAGVSRSSFWFYSDKLGWVWTGSSHYPYVYSNNESSWVRFFDIDDKLNPSINDSTVYRYLYIDKTSKYVRYDLY